MSFFKIILIVSSSNMHCQFLSDLTDLNVGSWRRTKDRHLSSIDLTLDVFSREHEHSSHTDYKGTVTVCVKSKLHNDVNVGDISERVSFARLLCI